MTNKPRYTKAQLIDTKKMDRIIERLDSDDAQRDLVAALRYHGLHVPQSLIDGLE